MQLEAHLKTLFDADRRIRDAEAALMSEGDRDAVAEVLRSAVDTAFRLDDRREATMRLERLADLCAQVPGPDMADVLVRILGDDDPAVRVSAGEALLDVGYERYAEVARAIERALDADVRGPAMRELPWLVAEIGEPSSVPLIRRFLEHPEPETIAAAIEALARLGDPGAVSALEPFVGDERTVPILDELEHERETTTATLGELARDAVSELSRSGGGR